VDGYHAGFVHESAFATFARFGISRYAQRPPIKREGLTRGFPGGHSTLEGGYEDGRGNARSLPQAPAMFSGSESLPVSFTAIVVAKCQCYWKKEKIAHARRLLWCLMAFSLL
jgi:hypothetical protein